MHGVIGQPSTMGAFSSSQCRICNSKCQKFKVIWTAGNETKATIIYQLTSAINITTKLMTTIKTIFFYSTSFYTF